MAFSGIATQNPIFLPLRISNTRSDSVARCGSVSFRGVDSSFDRIKRLSVRSASAPVTPAATEGLKPAISLTDNALKHLNKMRSDRGEDLCLRIGVKQGGCSGMSYTMDFENRANARPDDSLIEYQGFTIVNNQSCQIVTARNRQQQHNTNQSVKAPPTSTTQYQTPAIAIAATQPVAPLR